VHMLVVSITLTALPHGAHARVRHADGAVLWRGRGGAECGDMREFAPSDEVPFCEVFRDQHG
jgi:hypothetical protein